jgi:hypothetical protein
VRNGKVLLQVLYVEQQLVVFRTFGQSLIILS